VIGEHQRTIKDVVAEARWRIEKIRSERGSADKDYQTFLPLVIFVEDLLDAAAIVKRRSLPAERGDRL